MKRGGSGQGGRGASEEPGAPPGAGWGGLFHGTQVTSPPFLLRDPVLTEYCVTLLCDPISNAV